MQCSKHQWDIHAQCVTYHIYMHTSDFEVRLHWDILISLGYININIIYSIAVDHYAVYTTMFCVRGCDKARGEAEDTKRGVIYCI